MQQTQNVTGGARPVAEQALRLREVLGNARVAVVHEWLVDYSGSERVLEQMLNVLPDADLFSVVDFRPESLRGFTLGKTAKTTFIQRMPQAQKRYRSYLPLMPFAIEQLDVTGYDLVISSSHAVAKGVITGPNQLHLCMCYTPVRYAWDLQFQYLRESGLDRGLKGWVARWILHRLRMWDLRTVPSVDGFIAISGFIGQRIRKLYGRSSDVIYPPVDTTGFRFSAEKEPFYMTASRMVPYKKLDLIVEAFRSMPDKTLVVIGSGPDFEKVKAKAGPNVKLLGFQPFDVLRETLQRARAFIFAAEEDFGIAPLEAQASGTPVIAYARGGALETIRGLDSERPTGVFYDAQTPEAICQAVREFEARSNEIRPEECRENAERFGVERFRNEFAEYVERQWRARQQEPARREIPALTL